MQQLLLLAHLLERRSRFPHSSRQLPPSGDLMRQDPPWIFGSRSYLEPSYRCLDACYAYSSPRGCNGRVAILLASHLRRAQQSSVGSFCQIGDLSEALSTSSCPSGITLAVFVSHDHTKDKKHRASDPTSEPPGRAKQERPWDTIWHLEESATIAQLHGVLDRGRVLCFSRCGGDVWFDAVHDPQG